MGGFELFRSHHLQHLAPESGKALAKASVGSSSRLIVITDDTGMVVYYLGFERPRLSKEELCYYRELANLADGVLRQHHLVGAVKRLSSHGAANLDGQILIIP